MGACSVIGNTLAFWSFDTIINRQPEDLVHENESPLKQIQHFSYSSRGSDRLPTEQEKTDMYILELEREAYRYLLIISACLVCLAHGSNDVANAISPLLVELNITGVNKTWAYWMGGIGISLGLLTLGYKVMETVGKNVIKLDFYKGYAC